jgi:KaiC/GvpD/RAD55 family RecA-like ATPase
MKRNTPALRFLRLLLEQQRWELFVEYGFSESDFTDDAEPVLYFIQRYFDKHAVFPAIQLVEEEMLVKFPETASLQYIIDGLRDSLLGKKVREHIELAIKDLQNGNPRQALSHLQVDHHVRSTARSFRQTGLQRYGDAEDRLMQGIKGVEMPWPSLEAIYHKWENSTLTSILGMSSVGKSWISCACAAHAFKEGRRVLLVTLENTPESFERRLDSLIYKIPFEDIRTGAIDTRQKRAWKESLEQELTGDGDILIIGQKDVNTVPDLINLSKGEKPEILIIDGAYRLSDSSQSEKWAESSKIINDLQTAASRLDIPILATSQLNPSKNKKLSGYDMGFEARYAKEWMISPDNVIALVQDDDDRLFNRLSVKICKIRESGEIPGKLEFKVNCDRVRMNFSEILEEDSLEIEY